MMGAPDLFKSALGDLPEGDISTNALAAKALVRAGLAVVICRPGTKKPACTLDARAEKKADLDAQAQAQAAGNRYWHKVRHNCGKKHLITDVKDLTKARIKKLLESGANVGVMAGAGDTRLMVVDLDTAAQRMAFVATWERETGEDFTEPMTTASPGVRNVGPDGTEEWIHKDGGHYWLTLPDGVEIPPGVGVYEGEGGWKVYVRDSFALVPPSVRPEGPYRLTGSTLEAPQWLLNRLEAQAVEASERRERALERIKDGPQDIDDWAAVTPWSELLEAAGWHDPQAHDTCGCPIWTRPGNPAHIKSATAHEAGCSRYDTSLGYGPIHAWSDEVRWNGAQTVNKLTFLACEKHGGDLVAAMRSVGIEPRGAELPPLDPFETPADAGPKDREEVTPPMGDQTPSAAPSTSHEITGDRTPAELETAIYRLADRMSALDLRTRRAWPDTLEELTARELERLRAREAAKALYERENSRPEDLEGYLIDGDELDELPPASPLIPGVLNRESYAILSGRDGSMKTFVALDWALSLATGTPWNNKPVYPMPDRPRVLFLVGEGQAGFQKRVKAWKLAHGVTSLEGKFTALFRRVNFFRDQPSVEWLVQTVTEGGYGLVVLDHLRLISGGADGNGSDMGVVVDNVKSLVDATLGGSVLLISHTDKADNDTRGYSGIEDDSDTVWHAKRTGDEEDAGGMAGVRLKNTKQKDGEEHPDLELEPETVELGTHPDTGLPITSLVLKPADPFAPIAPAGAERVLELVLQDFSAIGASQADIRDALKLPKATCNRYVNQLVETGRLIRQGQKYWPAPGATAGELTA
ncbi:MULTISPECIES: AAA family ATPase [unclassified Nonomuraea]|uniref:AAA family ATPase n=1 Tax=unclassified Nonomuraea TaxID=2593643 RepID=UPI003411D92E